MLVCFTNISFRQETSMGNTANPRLTEVCGESAQGMRALFIESPLLVDSGVVIKDFVPGRVTFHIRFVRPVRCRSIIRGMAIACPTDRLANITAYQNEKTPMTFEIALIGKRGKATPSISADYQDTKTYTDPSVDDLIEEVLRVRDHVLAETG